MNRRIEILDALRGVAAMVVVVFHCMMFLPGFDGVAFRGLHVETWFTTLVNALARTPLRLLWDGGDAVDFFFLLSGFVLALPFFRQSYTGYGPFTLRRVCRIYIPYVAIFCFALLLMQLTAGGAVSEANDWFSAFWAHKITPGVLWDNLLMTGRPSSQFVDPPVWSLVHEMRVSLVFPALVYLVRRRGAGLTIAAIVCAYLTLRGLARLVAPADREALLYSLSDTTAYSAIFVIGIALARRWVEGRNPLQHCRSWQAFALVGLAIVIIRYSPSELGPIKAHVKDLPVGFGGAIIIAVSLSSKRAAVLLRAAPFQWLGTISYSLYLVHFPLLMSLIYLLHNKIGLNITVLLLPFAAVSVATLLYWLIERPSVELGYRLTHRIYRSSREPKSPSFAMPDKPQDKPTD